MGEVDDQRTNDADATSWLPVGRGGREGIGRQLYRGGARHPQVLEAGAKQPRDAGLRCGPSRLLVKWTDLPHCPLSP